MGASISFFQNLFFSKTAEISIVGLQVSTYLESSTRLPPADDMAAVPFCLLSVPHDMTG